MCPSSALLGAGGPAAGAVSSPAMGSRPGLLSASLGLAVCPSMADAGCGETQGPGRTGAGALATFRPCQDGRARAVGSAVHVSPPSPGAGVPPRQPRERRAWLGVRLFLPLPWGVISPVSVARGLGSKTVLGARQPAGPPATLAQPSCGKSLQPQGPEVPRAPCCLCGWASAPSLGRCFPSKPPRRAQASEIQDSETDP